MINRDRTTIFAFAWAAGFILKTVNGLSTPPDTNQAFAEIEGVIEKLSIIHHSDYARLLRTDLEAAKLRVSTSDSFDRVDDRFVPAPCSNFQGPLPICTNANSGSEHPSYMVMPTGNAVLPPDPLVMSTNDLQWDSTMDWLFSDVLHDNRV